MKTIKVLGWVTLGVLTLVVYLLGVVFTKIDKMLFRIFNGRDV